MLPSGVFNKCMYAALFRIVSGSILRTGKSRNQIADLPISSGYRIRLAKEQFADTISTEGSSIMIKARRAVWRAAELVRTPSVRHRRHLSVPATLPRWWADWVKGWRDESHQDHDSKSLAFVLARELGHWVRRSRVRTTYVCKADPSNLTSLRSIRCRVGLWLIAKWMT